LGHFTQQIPVFPSLFNQLIVTLAFDGEVQGNDGTTTLDIFIADIQVCFGVYFLFIYLAIFL
jgi:hypothetical protein